jgi:hypothetical protein
MLDLAVITSYFNPLKYQTRLSNYKIFRERLEQQEVPCLTIECVLDNALPELEPSHNTLIVRSQDILWQKERLLNLALDSLPCNFTKVAWLDCDTLFPDNSWAIKASELLDKYIIIQPFEWAVMLPRELSDTNSLKQYLMSFAASVSERYTHINSISTRHGHTGFAWAARRDLLTRHRLYDAAIIGNGDHLIAHAIRGDWGTSCISRVAPTREFIDHYFNWAVPFHQEVKNNIGNLRGEIHHLWHGELKNRSYIRRSQGLIKFEFDPDKDLEINYNGVWEWASSKPNLHQWVKDYFIQRQEDGRNT